MTNPYREDRAQARAVPVRGRTRSGLVTRTLTVGAMSVGFAGIGALAATAATADTGVDAADIPTFELGTGVDTGVDTGTAAERDVQLIAAGLTLPSVDDPGTPTDALPDPVGGFRLAPLPALHDLGDPPPVEPATTGAPPPAGDLLAGWPTAAVGGTTEPRDDVGLPTPPTSADPGVDAADVPTFELGAGVDTGTAAERDVQPIAAGLALPSIDDPGTPTDTLPDPVGGFRLAPLPALPDPVDSPPVESATAGAAPSVGDDLVARWPTATVGGMTGLRDDAGISTPPTSADAFGIGLPAAPLSAPSPQSPFRLTSAAPGGAPPASSPAGGAPEAPPVAEPVRDVEQPWSGLVDATSSFVSGVQESVLAAGRDLYLSNPNTLLQNSQAYFEHAEGKAENLRQTASLLASDPVAGVRTVLALDTWDKDPARWLGHQVPGAAWGATAGRLVARSASPPVSRPSVRPPNRRTVPKPGVVFPEADAWARTPAHEAPVIGLNFLYAGEGIVEHSRVIMRREPPLPDLHSSWFAPISSRNASQVAESVAPPGATPLVVTIHGNSDGFGYLRKGKQRHLRPVDLAESVRAATAPGRRPVWSPGQTLILSACYTGCSPLPGLPPPGAIVARTLGVDVWAPEGAPTFTRVNGYKGVFRNGVQLPGHGFRLFRPDDPPTILERVGAALPPWGLGIAANAALDETLSPPGGSVRDSDDLAEPDATAPAGGSGSPGPPLPDWAPGT